METNKFDVLKSCVQEIINFLAVGKSVEAIISVRTAEEILHELLDFTTEKQDLLIIRQYELLLKQLKVKANQIDFQKN